MPSSSSDHLDPSERRFRPIQGVQMDDGRMLKNLGIVFIGVSSGSLQEYRGLYY